MKLKQLQQEKNIKTAYEAILNKLNQSIKDTVLDVTYINQYRKSPGYIKVLVSRGMPGMEFRYYYYFDGKLRCDDIDFAVYTLYNDITLDVSKDERLEALNEYIDSMASQVITEIP